MALEKDFELLDDFLSNRLNESDKTAFEKKIEGDTELKQELKVQQELMEGIRKARVSELKSLLNNVPVPPISNPTSVLVKAGAWTIVTGLILTGAYFYFSAGNEEDQLAGETESATQPADKPETPEDIESNEEVVSDNKVVPETKSIESTKSVKPKGEKPVATKTIPAKPEIKAFDPTKEAEEETADDIRKYEQEQLEIISKAFVTSSMEVETVNADKQYKFHYVFKGGKLVLYGAFEKNLYEILEFINNEKKTVVLFYQTNYYLLDVNKSNPTLLSPIKDKALLKKLSQYRGH